MAKNFLKDSFNEATEAIQDGLFKVADEIENFIDFVEDAKEGDKVKKTLKSLEETLSKYQNQILTFFKDSSSKAENEEFSIIDDEKKLFLEQELDSCQKDFNIALKRLFQCETKLSYYESSINSDTTLAGEEKTEL